MFLVDTSVWVEHFRSGVPRLMGLLDAAAVLGHPWVIGEISLGNLSRREETLDLLRHLPRAEVATADELERFINRRRLYGLGIGYVDVALLAATALTPDARLWTRDRRLKEVSRDLGLAAELDSDGIT